MSDPHADQETLLARAHRNIQRYRTRPVTVRVLSREGRPVQGASVEVVQTRHSFLFGCNIQKFDLYAQPDENATYKRLFAKVFNFATIGIYWNRFEPEKGVHAYRYVDRILDWCEAQGIVAKGHSPVWNEVPAGVPSWLPKEPKRARAELKAFTRDLLSYYRGRMDMWDVVNEPTLAGIYPGMGRSPAQYVATAHRWAQQANPEATLVVNEYRVIGDVEGRAAFHVMLERLNERGTPWHALGMQAHEPRTTRFDARVVWDSLNAYSDLGKPIHITEFCPLSGPGRPHLVRTNRITDSWKSGEWNEAEQAEYAEMCYRLFFAHPKVEAITWWDLGDKRSWLGTNGLLREDFSPKPTYRVLDRLVNREWRTRGRGVTDARGRYAFRGFCGDYRVTATLPGGTRVKKDGLGLGTGRRSAWTISV